MHGAHSVNYPVPAAGTALPPGVTLAAVSPAGCDTACRVCRATQPEHNMLLCDGCDGGFHTSCLQPALGRVPEGRWFCPPCEADILAAPMAVQQAAK